jgi:general secretion pathway protein C
MLLLLGSSAYHVASVLGRSVTGWVENRGSRPGEALSSPALALANERADGNELLPAPNALAEPFGRSLKIPPGGLLSAPDCEAIAVHIVTESEDRAWSLATVSVAGEPQAHLCRVGDQVAGHRVEFIGFNPRQSAATVWLSRQARVCQASVAAGFRVSSSAVVREPALEPSGSAEIAANVQRISDAEFNLSRPGFEKLYENALQLGSQLRAVPDMKNGKVIGVRLSGIKPGSWFSALGIRNGDRVESVNGFDFSDPLKLFEAYARLKTASEVTVKLNRHGSAAQIAVHIR